MLRNSIWRSAFELFILTMIIFFIVQILFKGKAYFQFSDFQYILATSIANAFVITTIYAIIAATNMLRWVNNPKATFGRIFQLTFMPGVIAGMLSLIIIFGYYHYLDPAGIEQLKTEYLDYSLAQAEVSGVSEEVAQIVNSKEVRATNLLSFRTFTLILGVVIFFNLSLALMLTFLWKIRNTPTR